MSHAEHPHLNLVREHEPPGRDWTKALFWVLVVGVCVGFLVGVIVMAIAVTS